MDLFFLQLLSYSTLTWLAFAAIATTTPFFLGWRWIPAGILLIGFIVAYQDTGWIREQMSQQKNGVPYDMDGIFMLGLVLRVILINTVLLPLTFLGAWLHLLKDCPPPRGNQ